ncbi:hypothetical protein SK128_028342 [Halocaridina rubra]|uniref:Uncharacterized protein n=1 Tax=Halocaridina rubra TaxID=373956 RepID=A0AAN9A1N7_HALRR
MSRNFSKFHLPYIRPKNSASLLVVLKIASGSSVDITPDAQARSAGITIPVLQRKSIETFQIFLKNGSAKSRDKEKKILLIPLSKNRAFHFYRESLLEPSRSFGEMEAPSLVIGKRKSFQFPCK